MMTAPPEPTPTAFPNLLAENEDEAEAEEAVAEEAEEDPLAILQPQIDDELSELLGLDEEEESEEDEDEEPLAVVDAEDEGEDEFVLLEGYDEEELPEPVRKVLARARKAEKRLQHIEKRQIERDRKHWLSQDAPKFPAVPPARAAQLAAQARSRQEFARALKAEHDLIAPHIASLLGQKQKEIETQVLKERQTLREQAAQAWGQPVVSAPASATPVADSPLFQLARERRGLSERMKGLIGGGMRL